jgi:hypothetical protein
MPPGGQEMMGGDEGQRIQQLISQIPIEQQVQLLKQGREAFFDMFMNIFQNEGIEAPEALDLTGILWEALATNVQVATNQTLSDILPEEINQISGEQMEQPSLAPQPQGPPQGGF